MRKQLLALLYALIVPALAFAQDVQLQIPGAKVVQVDRNVVVKVDVLTVQSFPFQVNAPKGEGLYFWSYPLTVAATDRGDTLVVTNAPKGELTVSVKCIGANLDKDGKFIGFSTKFGSVVVVGDVPAPVPPTPPDPPKPPEPPTPPAPIPTAGFRVLVVYETAELAKLPSAQLAALQSKEVRDYLNAKCAVGVDGKTKEWRIWDQNVATSSAPKLWQDVMARPRASVPWVVISNGTTGYEGPLPGNTTDVLNLLKKYGGN